jgi:hypothetical protein
MHLDPYFTTTLRSGVRYNPIAGLAMPISSRLRSTVVWRSSVKINITPFNWSARALRSGEDHR